MSNEIILKKESTIIIAALEQTITTSTELNKAVEMLSQLNKINDRITTEKEKITKPLNEALKAERARWKPAELDLERGIQHLRSEMSTYQTEQLRIQKIEQDKIAARVGEGKGKLKAETAIAKMDAIEKSPDKVNTQAGAVKFRTDKKLKITDKNLIPLEYMLPNESALLMQLKNGAIIPGCELVEIQTPINFR